MTHRWRAGLAVASGLLLWLSFPNPFAMHFEAWTGALAFVALVPLLALLADLAPAQGFQYGFVAGAAFFLPGLVWITNVKPLGLGAVPAWCGLAAWCALFVGAFGGLAALGLRRGLSLPLLWLPALWTLLEALREHLLTGFPWLSLGSSQFANPVLLPLAALTGQPGLHFAVVLVNTVVCAILLRPRWVLGWARTLSALLVLAALAAGARQQAQLQRSWDTDGPPAGSSTAFQGLKVGVIQGGIDQDQAWNQAYRDQLMDTYLTYSSAAEEQGANLILWPESSFPGFFNEDAPEYERVRAFARSRKVTLLIGSTLSKDGKYSNSAVLVPPSGEVQTYAKRHLVPFGEYVPFRSWVPFLDRALEQFGIADFTAGTQAGAFHVHGAVVAPLICYESVFPDLPGQGEAPDLLALLTVDTWYGISPGPVWHASQAAIRAVENGCWVARAAATGISLVAAPSGEIRLQIGLAEAGALVQALGPARPTPFRAWGNWFLVLCVLILLLAWAGSGIRRKNA